MTNDELQYLRFNVPIRSMIDGTIWYYDCKPNPSQIRIFKELIDTLPTNMGRYFIGHQDPWRREGSLTVPIEMFMEDFEVVYPNTEDESVFVKLSKDLVTPYSIINPNFHMLEKVDDGLPF
jgi:hypothetical protein